MRNDYPPLMFWTQPEAIEICRLVELICPHFGYHVGLTGGCLYKDGPRKDLDLVFYKIRKAEPDQEGMFKALRTICVEVQENFGFCVKATYKTKSIDLLFPEQEGEYISNAEGEK